MPSLKDLKIRIETPSSRRARSPRPCRWLQPPSCSRAQEAAENGPALCRAHGRCAWKPGLRRPFRRQRLRLRGFIARHRQGRRAPHLLVVATAERGLCGGFNSSIAKLARSSGAEADLKAKGKKIKILTVGKKGREQLQAANFPKTFVGHVDLSHVKRVGYENASRGGAPSDASAVSTPANSMSATIFFNKLPER